MYLDVLASDGFIVINKKIATIFGLNTAAYIAELVNILKRAVRKEKCDKDGFMTLNRKYIENQTTLSVEDQLTCDKLLCKYEIITISENDQNQIYFDVKKLMALLVDEDVENLIKLSKSVKSGTKKAKSMAKRDAIIQNLKTGIIETDEELLEGYRNWVDSVFASGNFLTKQAIIVFQDTINKYTNDRIVKKELLNEAIVCGYKEAAWVINRYEQNYKSKINSRSTGVIQLVSPSALSEVGF